MRLDTKTLLRTIADKLPSHLEPSILLLTLDNDANGAFTRDAGLMAAIDRVSTALLSDEALPAILFIDVLDEKDVQTRASAIPGAARLFDWPGTAYLRLVFDDASLQRAAENALAGRSMPFPSACASELRAQLANVKHWLERFRQNAVGAWSMAADVAKGDLPVTALTPQQWLSAKHLASLNRLIAALTLSDYSAAASPMIKVRNAFMTAALDFEAEKARTMSLQASQNAGSLTLGEAAYVLMVRATSLSAAIVEIDSKLCLGEESTRGPRV